jgi:DNA-binding GntR family transcriptional regulator
MIKNTGRPGYLQIADDLRRKIDDGELAPGDALPSISQLCEQYEATLGVVKSAISVLRTEGRIVGQQGKGVFVRDEASSAQAQPVDGNGVTEQLSEILTAVRDLGDRVARLEKSVFPEPPKARRSGR